MSFSDSSSSSSSSDSSDYNNGYNGKQPIEEYKSYKSVSFFANARNKIGELPKLKLTTNDMVNALINKVDRFDNPIKSDIKKEIFALSENEKMYRFGAHGFLEMLSYAYDNHLPVCIYPGDIKIIIEQAFSKYVNDNSESMRELFVNHEGKKELFVRTGSIERTASYWNHVTDKFSEEINENINDKELINHMRCSFSTTTVNESIVSNIAVMDTFKEYFAYILQTLCGIPEYRFYGSIEDWTKLLNLSNYISKYMINYSKYMSQFINKVIDQLNGIEDPDYFDNFVKHNNRGSGTPHFTGHVIKLIQYFSNTSAIRKDGPSKSNCYNNEYDMLTRFTSDEIHNGINCVDFIWEDLITGIKHDMQLIAGFGGFAVNNGALKCTHLWTVIEKIKNGN